MRWFLIAALFVVAACEKAQPEPECLSVPACQEGMRQVTSAEECESARCVDVSECGKSIRCIDDAQQAESWKLADEAELDPAQLEAVSTARGKQQELGKQLVTTLTASIAEKGFAESVTFCKVEAPKLTSGAQGDVALGRTSHALRNPANAAPEWAAETVAAKTPGKFVFTGPQGKLGVLSPIMMAEVCVNCHGPADKLADGVPEALASLYPDDQATGFEAGQLRGWFWAEVSPRR